MRFASAHEAILRGGPPPHTHYLAPKQTDFGNRCTGWIGHKSSCFECTRESDQGCLLRRLGHALQEHSQHCVMHHQAVLKNRCMWHTGPAKTASTEHLFQAVQGWSVARKYVSCRPDRASRCICIGACTAPLLSLHVGLGGAAVVLGAARAARD